MHDLFSQNPGIPYIMKNEIEKKKKKKTKGSKEKDILSLSYSLTSLDLFSSTIII